MPFKFAFKTATVLCLIRSEHANNGLMSIRRVGRDGLDVREVVLDWPTNRMPCLTSDVLCGEPSATVATPMHDCPSCPCTPDYTLPDVASSIPMQSNVLSPYVQKMCRWIAKGEQCRFKRGVVVGLGTGYLSGCLAHHCPNLELTTLDVDPDVLWVANAFFGWANRSTVVVGSTERWFRRAADKAETYDLVLVDCYTKHGLAPGCQQPMLLASIRRVLRPTHPHGPTLFGVNIFGKSMAARGNFSSIVKRPGAVETYDGQWLSYHNP
jgi:hypothetical protein